MTTGVCNKNNLLSRAWCKASQTVANTTGATTSKDERFLGSKGDPSQKLLVNILAIAFLMSFILIPVILATPVIAGIILAAKMLKR